MKNNSDFTDNNLLFVKPCMLFFIQTLPRILCAIAVSRVSFIDLFGPIAGAINPIRLLSSTSMANSTELTASSNDRTVQPENHNLLNN